MQEVDISSSLLVEFSTTYGRVPIVEIGGDMAGIPFSHHILACWVTQLKTSKDNSMYQVFTAWLCGTDRFLHPDTPSDDIMLALADSLRQIVVVDDDS